MGEWKGYKLKELITKIGSGATPRGGDNSYKSEGISLIRSQNVLDLSFSIDGLAFIDDEQADELSNVTVQEDDVLLNITGDSVARVCKVPKAVLPARVNQHVSIIRTHKDRLDGDFLLYQLVSRKEELLSMAEIGATRRALTKGMIEELPVQIPPLPEQRAIASVLSSLDDKIDLLHRQNKTLEALAETVFREWFVESEEERSEKATLRDIADHAKDSITPSKRPDMLYSHYSVPAYDEGRVPKKELGKTILSNKYRVYSNSILVSKLNPRIPRVWPVFGEIDESSAICSTEFQVVRPRHPHYFGFVQCFLKQPSVSNELANAVGGTSGSHQRVDPDVIFSLSFPKPHNEQVQRFGVMTNYYWSKITKNNNQIHTLTQLRDTLLPKLMSGEVRVKT